MGAAKTSPKSTVKPEDIFIDQDYIEGLLKTVKHTDDHTISAYLDKAERFEGLNHREIAARYMLEDFPHLVDVTGKAVLETGL